MANPNIVAIAPPQTRSANFSKPVRRMLGFDLESWETALVASLMAAALAAVFVGVATWTVIKLQRQAVRDSAAAFETYKLEAGKQISEANARTAEANLQIAELNLQLAKLRAPRKLSEEQQARLAEQVAAFEGQEYSALIPPAGIDVQGLWIELDRALTFGKWVRVDPIGAKVGDPIAGVSLNASPGVYMAYAPSRASDVGRAAAVLSKELNSAGIVASAGPNDDAEKRPSVIVIVIGLKPQ